jgi:ribose 5-phosphate isomerase A
MSNAMKQRAADAALAYVADGMRLGLGTGSTAALFVEALARRVKDGLQVVGVATSEATARLAHKRAVPLASLDEMPELDLTVDGADEIGPGLALIKGGGGALTREKIVAFSSRQMIVVADSSKLVDVLGAFPLPMEALPFGLTATRLAVERAAEQLGLTGNIAPRRAGSGLFTTDNGNAILDASFGRIPDPESLAGRLAAIPGIVEHGLFLGLASRAIVAGEDGVTEIEA